MTLVSYGNQVTCICDGKIPQNCYLIKRRIIYFGAQQEISQTKLNFEKSLELISAI